MKRRICLWSGVAVCAAGLLSQATCAEPAAEQPATVKIEFYPAAAPVPALKYQLLPPMIERRPGNAAVLYGKVTAEQSTFFGNQQLQEKMSTWLEVPFDKFPKDEVRKEFSPPLHFLKLASRCESCDWDLPIREEMFYSILLPDVQQTRTFGRMLALQARVHIAYREYDKAIEMLQMGFALGRHAAEQPTLVSGLVGCAIHRQMLERTRELITQPDAPNLYWALSMLPRPMISFHKAYESEMYWIYFSFPELRDLDKKDYPPAYWTYLLDKVVGTFGKLASEAPTSSPQQFPTIATVLEGYPKAKQGLIDQGRTAAEVDKMPPAQVILLYTTHTYDEMRDDMMKWVFLPYIEAKPGLQRVEQTLRDSKDGAREVFPLASLLLPAMGAVKNAEVRGQREIALLEVLSALRLYAAGHGQLPASLKDITEVPVPMDPVHGEPFVYQTREAGSAVLEMTGPAETLLRGVTRYEITLKK